MISDLTVCVIENTGVAALGLYGKLSRMCLLLPYIGDSSLNYALQDRQVTDQHPFIGVDLDY